MVGNAYWDAQHGHGGHQPPDHGGPPGVSVPVDRQLVAVDAVKNENCLQNSLGYNLVYVWNKIIKTENN